MALVYVHMGEKERALEWLERAYKDRDGQIIWIKVEPSFESLRSDPRFEDLVRRVGLTW